MGVSITDLFRCNRVPYQRQVRQLCETTQWIQIRELSDPILREDQGVDIGYGRRDVRLDIRDPVLSQHQHLEVIIEREVSEVCDIVVGEINRIVGLLLVISINSLERREL